MKNKFILDILFDDLTGGLKRPRVSRPEETHWKYNICNRIANFNKEYRFVHFTMTDANGIHKYITIMIFFHNNTLKYESKELNEQKNIFESASKIKDDKNLVPIATCAVSMHPFFWIHKQFWALLYETLSQNLTSKEPVPEHINFDTLTIEKAEEWFNVEFLISLFWNHLKIDENYEPAHIILERRRKVLTKAIGHPLSSNFNIRNSDMNPLNLNSVSSLRDSSAAIEIPAKVVLYK